MDPPRHSRPDPAQVFIPRQDSARRAREAQIRLNTVRRAARALRSRFSDPPPRARVSTVTADASPRPGPSIPSPATIPEHTEHCRPAVTVPNSNEPRRPPVTVPSRIEHRRPPVTDPSRTESRRCPARKIRILSELVIPAPHCPTTSAPATVTGRRSVLPSTSRPDNI
ncbi:unnamed protein product [Ceutorhynchus assimilis]|uniref:Uncharacterized protein n=1 Tax=Ceutorhynchus assimilis TaxID=467358 RepID=A0A9N9QAS6_9CUCU|nr:unnamed protein product [Ceutorhynchus assimilis]